MVSDPTLELHDAQADESTASSLVLFFAAPLMGAAAGGMGWGIRGQYGHEWGAMVPGVLVAFTFVFLFCRRATSLRAARAVALAAIGFSFGGVMTYGQTVGLTQDTPLVGNHDAYRWGMIGLFLKGGLWIGFGATFLGMGLGGKRYQWLEMLKVYVVLSVLVIIGISLLNRPYVPDVSSPDRVLPSIYFSDHWDWEPEKLEMKPRRERWGGLLLAFLALVAYVRFFKKDKLAFNLAWCGVVAGGVGFTIGQALQSKHSWTPNWLVGFDRSLHEALPSVFPEKFFSLMGYNWWNMMETTFGLVMGFLLGLGFWLNRKLVARGDTDDPVEFSSKVEWLLIGLHACALALWGALRVDEIQEYEWLTYFTDFPLAMGLLPVICILGGRYWPYLFSLPMIAISIAGITLKGRYDGEHVVTDWFLLIVVPLGIMTLTALHLAKRGLSGQIGRSFARRGLILSAFMYYSLNFAFFGLPWTVLPQRGSHTNDWIFLRCMELLVFGALLLGRRAHSAAIEERGR